MLSLAKLRPDDFLSELSTARDTVLMQENLGRLNAGQFDAGDAGTVFRFLVARLAIQAGKHILTGSIRMQERPIGPLVDAIRQLGIEVQYLRNEGYPPIEIYGKAASQISVKEVHLQGDISSQFISALLMIAPLLPQGLVIHVAEPRVSWSYVQMTIEMMRNWGIKVEEQSDGSISIAPSAYLPKPLIIEPDWSSASYWCSIAALSSTVHLHLPGLSPENSLQGDAKVVDLFRRLGLQFTQEADGISITKDIDAQLPRVLSANFTTMPDVAQTIAVACAGLGISGLYTGLETLKVKETDRVLALKKELSKIGVSFVKMPPHMSKRATSTQYMLEGKADLSEASVFETYEDHRMAMSFAPLALQGTVQLEDPEVVGKSYPAFWDDLKGVGFVIEN